MTNDLPLADFGTVPAKVKTQLKTDTQYSNRLASLDKEEQQLWNKYVLWVDAANEQGKDKLFRPMTKRPNVAEFMKWKEINS